VNGIVLHSDIIGSVWWLWNITWETPSDERLVSSDSESLVYWMEYQTSAVGAATRSSSTQHVCCIWRTCWTENSIQHLIPSSISFL